MFLEDWISQACPICKPRGSLVIGHINWSMGNTINTGGNTCMHSHLLPLSRCNHILCQQMRKLIIISEEGKTTRKCFYNNEPYVWLRLVVINYEYVMTEYCEVPRKLPTAPCMYYHLQCHVGTSTIKGTTSIESVCRDGMSTKVGFYCI